MKNAEIARIFAEIADMLDFLGDSPFRVRAYRAAARYLMDMEEPIERVAEGGEKALDELPYIGHDLALKILEYLRTGKVRKHEELKKKVPPGVLEVMRVPGVGPKTAKRLYDELGVDSLERLRQVLESGEVLKLAGFGEKKRARLLHNLELVEAAARRRPLGEVLWQARELVERLEQLPQVEEAALAGSARRYRETVGDLDLLAASRRGRAVTDAFVRFPEVDEVLLAGASRATVFLKSGLQVDLKIVEPDAWGSGLQYFTGSKDHSIHLRTMALDLGLKINEYGVWKGAERVAGRTEEEVYGALGLPWIPPPLREDRGEIEAARAGRLPELVTLEQIRGDLQVHSTWSDGKATLEELAAAAAGRGYEYLAVTDHSPAVRVAGGVPPEKVGERLAAIRAVNEKTGGRPYLLAGAEVDILPDGSLDYPDEVLAELEIVLVAIHAHFNLGREEQTRRILRALENPYVHVLAHPTTRHLGRRGPIEADWEKIFERARELGKAVEIDGYYNRLDLPDSLARRAGELGLMVSLSTDAHATDHLRFMELAVGTAQRAWLGPRQVLNTRDRDSLLSWLREARSQ
ncbi:DNA polymerase/3'-5' exonuclease PolX [Oceanithermus sp.]